MKMTNQKNLLDVACRLGGSFFSIKSSRFIRRRAFTLLEIMIAMTIFAVVVTAIYSSWMTIVRGAKAGQNAAVAAQRSRVAMRTIEDALLTAQLSSVNIQHYSFVADTSEPKFAWLSFVSRLPASFPGSGLFGDLVVRRVTFAVEPDADGTNKLIMTQMPLLLVTNSENSPYPITLARDVSLFVLEFWDPQLNDWTDELLTTNQLPTLVRVSLSIGSSSGPSSRPVEVASRIVAVPSLAIGVDVQQPTRQRTAGAGGINSSGQGTHGNGQGLGSEKPIPINPGNPNGGFPGGGFPGGGSGGRPTRPGGGTRPR